MYLLSSKLLTQGMSSYESNTRSKGSDTHSQVASLKIARQS